MSPFADSTEERHFSGLVTAVPFPRIDIYFIFLEASLASTILSLLKSAILLTKVKFCSVILSNYMLSFLFLFIIAFSLCLSNLNLSILSNALELRRG
jgi:hypothetical protein